MPGALPSRLRQNSLSRKIDPSAAKAALISKQLRTPKGCTLQGNDFLRSLLGHFRGDIDGAFRPLVLAKHLALGLLPPVPD